MATNTKPLTKAQISSHIADSAGITKKAANEILDELASLAYRETKRKGEITLPGIGKLVLQKRKARMGRNPATGETIKIPAKKVVKFRVAKACKDSVLG
ncbi:MAG: HU family DNA-binding protein [Candidatus Dadabacteria bacterium]|nr:HU family DNA-binding protein [Candidatus Dadabacteria bacterium]